MVKVQKPKPKSLDKMGQSTLEKTKKKEASVVAKSVAPAKKQKQLKEAVKSTEIATPVKKVNKKDKEIKEKVKPVLKPTDRKKPTKKAEDPAVKHKPLILPPPESPAPPTPVKAAVKKTEKKNVKKDTQTKTPLVVAPADSPVVKTKKRQSIAAIKKAKKALKAKEQPAATKDAKTEEPSKPLTKKQRVKANKRAFMKTKRAKNLKDEATKEQKKPKRIVTIEPTTFDEEKFHSILNTANIEKIAEALKTQVAEEVKKQKTSIFSDYRYFLNVASFKIPNVPKRMVKLGVKQSLVNDDDDVAIIVPDLQRGAKVEYEPTIQHYEDLFREAGIVRPLKIVPFNQLRNEMDTFEAKRKFCNSYEYFLCDGRLVGQAHGFLGKFTQKPRAVLHAVSLLKSNLKDEIERGLRRTAYRQLQKGDLTSIPVGNHRYTTAQLTENILFVIEQLKNLHAGGYANIRSLNLKIDIRGTSSLPLYISTSLPPPETPFVIGPREERMLKLKKDANKVLANFTLTKDAKLIKLNPEQVEHKRKLREAHAALTQEKTEETVDNDGEDSQVPTKKARKEDNAEADVKRSASAEDDDSDEDVEDAEDDDADSDDDEDDADGDNNADSDEEVDDDDEEEGDEDDDDEEGDDDDEDEDEEDDDDDDE